MEFLADFGIFLAGLGVFLLGCGLMWWISLHEKYHKSNQKKEK